MNSGGSKSSKSLKIITALLFVLALMFILTWAPWLNNEKISLEVYKKRAHIDGTTETGCEYKIMIAPFGRWAASCEGGYFIAFWDAIF